MTATISGLPSATLPVDVNSLLELAVPNGTAGYVSRKATVGSLRITLGSTNIALMGSATSVSGLTLTGASVWQGSAIGLSRGGTGTDLSATGGTAQILMQESPGALITVRALTAGDFPGGATGSGAVVRQVNPSLSSPSLSTPTLSSPTLSGSAVMNGTLTVNGTLGATSLRSSETGALVRTGVSLTNGAGVGAGTISNAPSAGNPTKWIPIIDNGTTRYLPTWT